MGRHRVEWIGSVIDGLMRSSKGQERSGSGNGAVLEGRDGREKGQPLGEKREERRE